MEFIVPRKHYILAETELHPVVIAQTIELSYLLVAYGLVPTEHPQTAVPRPNMTDDTA
jgi:hypothetical protein